MRKVLQATVFSICATPFFSNCGQPAQDRFHFPFLDGEGFRGKAEIAVYEGTGLESGQGLPAELTLITVLESINPVQRVKTGTNTADSWPGVKQNQILSFQSGAKSYRSMNSLFWRKQDGGLLRASMTWQEPGGTTAKTLLPQGGVDRMNYHSFWENEADGELVVVRPEVASVDRAVLYDEMPLLARSPEAEHFRKLQVFPLLMSSQVRKPDWGPSGKQRQPGYQSGSLAPERAEIVIMGTQRRAFKITMRSGENAALVDEYFVEDNSNRTLLAWNRHDGAKFVLKRHNFETVDR